MTLCLRICYLQGISICKGAHITNLCKKGPRHCNSLLVNGRSFGGTIWSLSSTFDYMFIYYCFATSFMKSENEPKSVVAEGTLVAIISSAVVALCSSIGYLVKHSRKFSGEGYKPSFPFALHFWMFP